MEDCVFCKIVKTDKDQSKLPLFEDDEIIAVNDIRPSAPVHILCLPKEHVESIAYLDDTHREMVSRLIFTAKELAAKNGLAGYKLIFNVGKDGGQVIPHLHLHLLGGWKDGRPNDHLNLPKL